MKWIQVEESPAEAHESRCVEGEARCLSFMLSQHSSNLIPETQWTFALNSLHSGKELETWPVTKSALLATPVLHPSHPIAQPQSYTGLLLGRSPGEGNGYPLQYSGLGADCGSDHELLISNITLKLKKVGKITKSFKYDLNQIPYDYTVEMTNRFQGLDLTDRVPEEL